MTRSLKWVPIKSIHISISASIATVNIYNLKM